MCLVTEKFLICDGHCGETYGVDTRQRDGQQHRKDAREDGWLCENGKDYCPNCRKKLRDDLNDQLRKSEIF